MARPSGEKRGAASLKRDPNSSDGVAGPESGNLKMFSVPRAARSVKSRVCPSGDTSIGRRCCVPAGSSSSSTAVSRRFRARFNPTPRPTANRIDRLSRQPHGIRLAGRVGSPGVSRQPDRDLWPRNPTCRCQAFCARIAPVCRLARGAHSNSHRAPQQFRLPSPCDRSRRVARRSRATDKQWFRCGMQ